MPSEKLRVTPLQPAHAKALADMFTRCHNACYCRYFHFSGDKYAWQDRLANQPDESQTELIDHAERNSEEARGVIAIEPASGKVVGWLKLSPAASLQKVYDQRLYRKLECFERSPAGVFTLGCFFIDPAFRGQGLSKHLLAAAIDLARELGATSLEALPRGDAEDASDAERWMGSASTFVAAGFRVVHAFAPYPVLRLEL